jgi:signal transduction histidine kinase
MQLTLQQIAEARKVYDLYWDSYQKGDVDTFAATLDDNFEMIGTSENEICHNKEEGIEFFKGQAEELIGSVEMRNRQINAIPVGDMVLTNEMCDIYALAGTDWIFYSKIRISTWLRETGAGWKVVQQHGSLPDIRVQEGETLAIDKISRENFELRDAIKRRTVELENKNRELEIEAALERIRSRSMAMQKSEELREVIRVIYEQLIQLNFDISNAGFVMDYRESNDFNVWMADAQTEIPTQQYLPYYDHPFNRDYLEHKKNGPELFTKIYSFDEKNSWLKNLYKYMPWLPEELKESLLRTPALSISRILLKNIGLYVLNYNATSFTDAENATLLRIGKVFEQTYTRFIDLQKLEAHALQAENDLIAIKAARHKAEEALTELKATQEQLVQQEKLASLGQLTAGIAHEIKNPLNFVNNFSDVSLEMIDEALEELQQIGGNEHATEAAVILANIKSNLAKIHEHGSRADGIVKSMLMHSRGGNGKMEPVNLNELVKEYVNLSYHGMRVGKEAINVDIQLDLDDSVGDVPLIAEDFSRVILNMCYNAFDAMKETRNLREPKLSVRTKKSAGTITIEIEDNGPGIPDDIKDKILQPFFTTKKGTQGTGLGLSITNDIIKAHGGTLEIESQQGTGTSFRIRLS